MPGHNFKVAMKVSMREGARENKQLDGFTLRFAVSSTEGSSTSVYIFYLAEE